MKHRKRNAIKPGFHASVRSDGVLEMLCYEDIGEDFWSGGGVTAKSVKQQIDSAGLFSSISLRINSPGGDAFEGVAIGNLLKATGKTVNVCIDGIAASAASIIAMCGTTISMASNAMMMIHKAWTVSAGNADDMRKMADTLDKIDGAIAQTYVDRTGKSTADVMALMTAETWMSAADCLKDGFCTAISNDDDDAAMNLARKFKALGHFQRVPAALATAGADDCSCDCAACKDGNCSDCSNADCTDPDCDGCPTQAETDNKTEIPSNLSLFQAIQYGIDKRHNKATPAQTA